MDQLHSEKKNLTESLIEDKDVVESIIGGNSIAYSSLVNKYWPKLRQIGLLYGHNENDTEDLIQETFINAFYHLSTFRFDSSFKTWIERIMLHQCYHKREKLTRKRKLFADFSFGDSDFDPLTFIKDKNLNTGKIVSNNELREILSKAIEKLPKSYEVVFNLREARGMSVKQTASIMHISESNVKARLCRAKGMLREEIKSVYDFEYLR